MTTVEAGITDAALYRRGNFIAALARGLCLSLSLAVVLFLWNSPQTRPLPALGVGLAYGILWGGSWGCVQRHPTGRRALKAAHDRRAAPRGGGRRRRRRAGAGAGGGRAPRPGVGPPAPPPRAPPPRPQGPARPSGDGLGRAGCGGVPLPLGPGPPGRAGAGEGAGHN